MKFQFDDVIEAYTDKFPILRALKIGAGRDTERLYKLESSVTETIGKAAREILKLCEKNQIWSEDAGLYSHAIPQSLMAALDAFDRTSGEVAAISFLLSRGYEVSKP